MPILSPGTKAPEFSLPSSPDERVALRDLRGRPVILAFYPADWSPVCGDQMALYNECLPMFAEHGDAQLLGISVDGPWCHAAYAGQRGLRFPLLSDFEPKGAVARAYGAYDSSGVARRALFVIDAEGMIRWSYLSPVDVNPGADGILAALEQMQGRAVS